MRSLILPTFNHQHLRVPQSVPHFIPQKNKICVCRFCPISNTNICAYVDLYVGCGHFCGYFSCYKCE